MTTISGTDLSVLPLRRESEERFAAVGARMVSGLTDDRLSRWWSRRVEQAPGRVVLKTDTRVVSYRELDELATQVARAAHTAGVRAGAVVGLQLPASAAFLVLILGLARLGARLSLLSPSLRGRSLRHALSELPPQVLFTTPSGRAAIGDLEGFESPAIVELQAESQDVQKPSDSGLGAIEAWLARSPIDDRQADWDPEPLERSADETLFYIFTSGTTGLPKATQCSHRRYIAGASSEGILLELTQADCMYVVLPMFHIAALSAIGAALSVSGSVVIRPKFSASRFWEDVHAFSATSFQYLGEIVRYLLAQPERAGDRPNTLRAMIGAGLTTRTWRAFEERFGPVHIVESYGSSEGVFGIFNLDGVAGSVGRAPELLEKRLRIVRYDTERDELVRTREGRLVHCEEGATGELIARLADRKQFEGYSSEEATRSKLIEGAFEDGDLWYRSGDLFRQVDGYYFFAGRLGDTYRWKGENVSTQEVAGALCGCDEVEYAVVYGVEVPGHEGSAGMALVTPAPGRDFDGFRLHEQLVRELPAQALPLFVRIGDGRAILTETYKLGMADLKRQGYAQGQIRDPLYLLDARAKCYVPLSDESLRAAGLPPFASSEPARRGVEA